MVKKLLTVVAACSVLTGCPEAPTTELLPLEQYQLKDFKTAAPVTYWEIRRNEPNFSPEPTLEYTVEQQYDTTVELNSEQQALLVAASSQQGYRNACFMLDCAVYAVALDSQSASLITTDADLLAFLGPIDTVAELSVWLSSESYYQDVVSYQPVEGGYRALVNYFGGCSGPGFVYQHDVFVAYDGSITVLEAIKQPEAEEPIMCI